VQALILAGGEGTRLRPLTTTYPKPVVPLVDRPFIGFMLDWLRSHGVDFKDSAMAVGQGADALVLVTEWPEFGELDLAELASSMRGTLLIDGRNFLDADKVREAGLDYEGIGRPAHKHREPAAAG